MSGVRQRYLAHFRALAEDIFARRPAYRSIVLGASQYWADEADDAVHDYIVASERDLPVWPHVCKAGTYDDDCDDVPTEHCGRCEDELYDYLSWWHDNGEAIVAFEAFCHEGGTQDQPDSFNAMPAAIARRVGDTVEVSLIGPVQRPHAVLSDGAEVGAPDPMFDDPRALELYAQVCASPRDDGPRRVLADYLLEREVPRGELIAYGLEPSARAKYEELLAANRLTWANWIARCVFLETAVFDRGFLSECEVFATPDGGNELRGLPVWNSVEKLFVHPGSACILGPDMRALRELGKIETPWIMALATSPQPWAIETLSVDIATQEAFDALVATPQLPALRHLVISSIWTQEEAAEPLVQAPWFSQLERLTVYARDVEPALWSARQRELGIWVAVRAEHWQPVTTEGWELAFGPGEACEVTLRGFTPEATFAALRALLAKVDRRVVKLVPSHWYVPAPCDADWLSRDGQAVTL